VFDSLTKNLEGVFRKLRGTGVISEANTRDALREIRMALLEADVSYKVVKDFTARCLERALGQEVIRSVSPGQQVVKIVHDELVGLMGPVDHRIEMSSHGPTVIMLAGLQGSGKTTMAAKLGWHLQHRGRSPMLVAADVQRPAAIEQLHVLGDQLKIPVYSEEGGRPPRICERSLDAAHERNCDVVILDTAGRLHIDAELMSELQDIKERTHPNEILLVCDAMTGQDAVNSATEFNARLNIDGVILTKLDGDARGGAALSIKAVTGKPIKFIGVGEKLDAIEEFHPDRMAGRILGMGDVVSFVEKVQSQIDMDRAREIEEKIRKRSLTLTDFMDQLRQVKRMGNLTEMMGLVPGMGGVDLSTAQDEIPRIEAIICSMTPAERENPDVIDTSRRRRIATGSGTSTQDVNQLLKQFRQMKKMMKLMADSGKGKTFSSLKGATGLLGKGPFARRPKFRR
jgi:signal recognition particle subunit SRP54